MSATQTLSCTSVEPSKFKFLRPEDAEHFLTHGWLRVPNAIKQEYIDEWMSDLWTRLDFDPNDKSTWHTEYLHLPRHREVRAEDFAPKAWDAICDLVGGEDRLHPLRERWYGDQFICNFGSAARTAEEEPEPPQNRTTWHIDNDWFRQFLDSSGVALTVIHCFTDVLHKGGGTILCEDAIKGVCEFFYNHPEGLDPPDHNACCAHIGQCQQFTTLEAQAGDVILLHGLLPHTNSLNYRHYARVIANPHATLRDPYNFNRADGNYSLVEQVILRALQRQSIPEFHPTRERLFYYPRTAGFKRAKVQAELKRMIAAAKEKGLDDSAVDSIYLKGEEYMREHERRNGYDLPIGPNGLNMVQHK